MLSPVFDLIGKALRRTEPAAASRDAAKHRLQMVLVQDRVSLSANTLDAMRSDIIAVISRYLVIDEDATEVDVRRRGDSVILVSNIPITDVQKGVH